MIRRIFILPFIVVLISQPQVCQAQEDGKEQRINDDISPEQIAKINGYYGESRDLWLAPNGEKKQVNSRRQKITSVDEVSPYSRMFSMPHIQKALEFSDDQNREILELSSYANDSLAELGKRIDLATDEDRDKLLDDAKAVVAEFDKKIRHVVLPHQWDALNQIGLLEHVNRHGLVTGLASGPIGTILQVSQEQREEFQRKAGLVSAEMEKKLREIEVKAIDEMLSTLTESQSKQLEDMLGKDFREKLGSSAYKLFGELRDVANCNGCGSNQTTLPLKPDGASPNPEREYGKSVLSRDK